MLDHRSCEVGQSLTDPVRSDVKPAIRKSRIPLRPAGIRRRASLPDLNGLELQERISTERCDMPIIFLSSHVDMRMAVKAIKRGALEFLIKPFDSDTLLTAIRYAIKCSEITLSREMELHRLRADYESLSRREREVMAGWRRGC
jgi:FixJ family two-component response regulator